MSDQIIIEERYDQERGCGWRKPGGKYLVSGFVCRPCGKLPVRLGRCPICDSGIKPSRGWTWIGARALIAAGACDPVEECRTELCHMYSLPERAGLLWIGGAFYPTAESFMREAEAMGISRRISQIPRGFKVGETLVLLAHREIVFAWGKDPQPGIFAAFVPQAVEYVVIGDESQEELQRIVDQGCVPIRAQRRNCVEQGI